MNNHTIWHFEPQIGRGRRHRQGGRFHNLAHLIKRVLCNGFALAIITLLVATISNSRVILASSVAPESEAWSTIRAGIAQVDITPPLGRYHLFASGKIATSDRDPLHAKVLVLESQQVRIALVSLDLIAPFAPELFNPYRARLKQERGIDYVVLAASHTHNSPGTIFWPERVNSMPWTKTAMEKVYQAILKAQSDVVPVRIGVGQGMATIGTNRRIVTPHGVIVMWRNYPNKKLNQPVDPRVGVLRLDREDGSILAVVVHYACHPVTLMARNATDFSADYVGEMEKDVTSQLPGHPQVQFLQGGAGDINLIDTITGSGERHVVRYGRELAKAVVGAVQSVKTQDEPELSYKSEELNIPIRWSKESLDHLPSHPKYPFPSVWFEHMYRPSFNVPVGSVLLGNELALAILPGEPFIQFQFRLDHEFPTTKAWLVGYSNLYIGYIPTVRAAAEGGYGANGMETLLAVGAGDRLVQRAVEQLYEQRAWWHAVPRQLLKKGNPTKAKRSGTIRHKSGFEMASRRR